MSGPTSDLLTTAEACAYLNISRTTLYAIWSAHQIRRTVLGKRTIRWPKRELDAYLARKTREREQERRSRARERPKRREG